jgi:hypothetical protein
LIFSTAISAAFGAVFGAEGLIVFGAGMISTSFMVLAYKCTDFVNAHSEQIEAFALTVRAIWKTSVLIVSIPFHVLVWCVHPVRKTKQLVAFMQNRNAARIKTI